ncbi:Hypothetical predicted protein [Octopus vulgaris]|uniref:Uncharacterized protein n=1 Tax=Octopus vulgaris TaxID=6645 RepID=A0AA36EX30_OCTVU|nr:Hypothetical predicted protein [Octopus vulgaris]
MVVLVFVDSGSVQVVAGISRKRISSGRVSGCSSGQVRHDGGDVGDGESWCMTCDRRALVRTTPSKARQETCVSGTNNNDDDDEKQLKQQLKQHNL